MSFLALIMAILFALLPQCPTEDSTFCAWDAQAHGTQGHSFVAFGEDVRVFMDAVR